MPVDYDAIFGVEDYDPCAALAALRPVYMRALSGAAVQKAVFRDREVWNAATNITEFGNLIARLESECAKKRGRGPARFAIAAGSRRGC